MCDHSTSPSTPFTVSPNSEKSATSLSRFARYLHLGGNQPTCEWKARRHRSKSRLEFRSPTAVVGSPWPAATTAQAVSTVLQTSPSGRPCCLPPLQHQNAAAVRRPDVSHRVAIDSGYVEAAMNATGARFLKLNENWRLERVMAWSYKM
ncbi:hypothetical protein AAHA92_18460 [Salvia divinorum]|uniref:Uncharacterized protein n=1 Tax=Salvia divinorum TaxID=28513 RepID=A0ABD1H266_SALDI